METQEQIDEEVVEADEHSEEHEAGELAEAQAAQDAEHGHDADTQTDPDVLKEATAQGWVPLEEWVARGNPPEKHRSAETFVEIGNKSIPVMRRRLDNAERELHESKAAFEKRIERLDRVTKKALERQREALQADYDERLRATVETGDVDAHTALLKERDDKIRAFDAPDEPDEPEDNTQKSDPAAVAFIEDNPWYNTDPEKRAVADTAFNQSMAANPSLGMEGHLAAAKARVDALFSNGVGQQNNGRERTMADMKVESGTRGTTRNTKSKVKELPPEARQAGEEFIEQGLYKDMEAYAADYFAQD